MSNAFLYHEEPRDLIEQAQSMLHFVQSWAEMWRERTPRDCELSGLMSTLEATNLLLDKAHKNLCTSAN